MTEDGWKRDHEAMIAEVRTERWSRSVELLRTRQTNPLAEQIMSYLKTGGCSGQFFFGYMERITLATLRCDGCDPEWLASESALKMLRKSIGFQVAELAAS